MATGRIGVTPTLGVRWSKAPTGGTTALSGLDDNSVSLVYSVGYEQVYRNGVLLSRGNDYTATTGTSITLIDATITGDIIEVFAQQLVPLTDAISKGQFTAKGALLSATAASTPGVLGVGANDTVLTADSTTSTGLKWATVSAGSNWTLLNAGGTSLSGTATTTVSGISAKDKIMVLVGGAGFDGANEDNVLIEVVINNDSGSNYGRFGGVNYWSGTYNPSGATGSVGSLTGSAFSLGGIARQSGATNTLGGGLIMTGANASGVKSVDVVGSGSYANSIANYSHTFYKGVWQNSATVTSIKIQNGAGFNFARGTVYVYTSA
jgi:hypothetical protein